MRLELVSSKHWRLRRTHQGPDANHHQYQKQHPLHRKIPNSPLVGELIRPSSHGEDGGRLWINRSVSMHRSDVSELTSNDRIGSLALIRDGGIREAMT